MQTVTLIEPPLGLRYARAPPRRRAQPPHSHLDPCRAAVAHPCHPLLDVLSHDVVHAASTRPTERQDLAPVPSSRCGTARASPSSAGTCQRSVVSRAGWVIWFASLWRSLRSEVVRSTISVATASILQPVLARRPRTP